MRRTGAANRLVSLKHRVLGTQDANGQQVASYTAYASVWAEKLDVSGREYFAAQTKDAEITTRFRLRYRTDIVATDRLVCDGLDYEILQPPSEIGRREALMIFARAVVNV